MCLLAHAQVFLDEENHLSSWDPALQVRALVRPCRRMLQGHRPCLPPLQTGCPEAHACMHALLQHAVRALAGD